MSMDREKLRNIVLRELNKFNESKPVEQKVSLDRSIKRAFDTAQDNRGAFNEGGEGFQNSNPSNGPLPEKPLSATFYELGFDAAFPGEDFNPETYLRKLIDAVSELNEDFSRGLGDGYLEARDAESRENY